jgi:two-component system response regulator YesN
MYNLLVVDDEEIAVQGVSRGIDWSDCSIHNILEAYDVEEAKRLFHSNTIDVMITDIEMLESNGIQLLEWVKLNYPATETIFLTGHADFSYAQQAIQLGSFDYILKPVNHEYLKQVTIKALEKIRRDRETKQFNESYKVYRKLWETQLPNIVERFWQDLLNERIIPSLETLEASLTMYKISLHASGKVLPILIRVEQWKKELSTRDEEIMDYALRNAAAEMILEGRAGDVIQDKKGINLVLLYVNEETEIELLALKKNCMQYIEACVRYFYCSLSCYVGELTPIGQIKQTYTSLLEMERKNVTHTNSVLSMEDKRQRVMVQPLPLFGDWTVLFEMGKKQELLKRIADTFAEFEQSPQILSETIHAFQHGLLHMIYYVCHKKGVSADELFKEKEITDAVAATRSLNSLKAWSFRTVSVGIDSLQMLNKDSSAVVERVKQYIWDHMKEEFTREDVADAVFLNSAYLSRLFKKETGTSITDYILHVRINHAKALLAECNMKISHVAEAVGYTHFSHFSKMFKRVVGLSPQEYHKKFDDVIKMSGKPPSW